MKVAALCAGYGGLELGLQHAGTVVPTTEQRAFGGERPALRIGFGIDLARAAFDAAPAVGHRLATLGLGDLAGERGEQAVENRIVGRLRRRVAREAQLRIHLDRQRGIGAHQKDAHGVFVHRGGESG